MKLCECGCGEETSVSKVTNPKFGSIKDQQNRFIKGHNQRSLDYPFYIKQERWWLNCRDGSQVQWAHIIYEHHFLQGNELPEGMLVHHKNRIIDDDRPENLEIMTREQHTKTHRSKTVALEKNGEIKMFPSAVTASRFVGLNQDAVTVAIRLKCRVGGWNPSYQEN